MYGHKKRSRYCDNLLRCDDFYPVWELEFVGQSNTENGHTVAQFPIDSQVACEIISCAGEDRKSEVAAVAACGASVAGVVGVGKAEIVIPQHNTGVQIEVVNIQTGEVIGAANADDSVIPFVIIRVATVLETVFVVLYAYIGAEADDAGTCFPEAVFIGDAESGALGAVSIAAGERATQADTGANNVSANLEGLGPHTDCRKKGNHQ
jgi:hypothetical protein